jgi:mono/diheme cytochrome c family protein
LLNCSPLHSTDSASLAPEVSEETLLRGQQLYSQNCLGCHGSIDSTLKRGRDSSQISFAISNVPQMSLLNILTEDDVSAITAALNHDSSEEIVRDVNGRLQFQCESDAVSKTPLLKLTNREYQNSINSLLDSFSTSLKSDSQIIQMFSVMPLDTIVQDRDTYKEQAKLVTEIGTRAHFEIAYRASELISTSSSQILGSYPNTNSCLSAGTITSNCFRQLLTQLAGQAFRRPLSSGEVTVLVNNLWDDEASKTEKIQMAVIGVMQAPDFLYKAFDRGSPVANASNTLDMTPHELAAKISYLLTGGPPDAQLRNLANTGAILNAPTLDSEVERLLRTNAAEQTVIRLFRESYGYDFYDGLNFSANFRSGISTNGLDNAMNSELDDYFSHLVLNRDATFYELMTSRWSSIGSQALANIYGASVSSDQNLVEMRSGFLNRAAMLTKRSGSRASPIKRGLSVLEHVLCKDVGLPPPSAPTSLPDFGNEILNTRQTTYRTTEVRGTSCVACHTSMNNLGYAFESFDSLGRARTREALYNAEDVVQQYLGIDTAASTSELGESPFNYSNSVDLVHGIGRSDKAMMCFVKHLKRFESRDREQSTDNCQMNEVLSDVYGENLTQGSIKDTFKNLIKSDSFRKWSY